MLNWLRKLLVSPTAPKAVHPDQVQNEDPIARQVIAQAWNTGQAVFARVDDAGEVEIEELSFSRDDRPAPPLSQIRKLDFRRAWGYEGLRALTPFGQINVSDPGDGTSSVASIQLKPLRASAPSPEKAAQLIEVVWRELLSECLEPVVLPDRIRTLISTWSNPGNRKQARNGEIGMRQDEIFELVDFIAGIAKRTVPEQQTESLEQGG